MAANPSAAAPAPELTITIETTPAGATVHCSGKITASSTPLLQEKVLALLPGTKKILLELGKVNYLDSSGLGSVVRLWMSSRKAECEFKVANLTPRLKDLFTITNLSSVFENVDHAGM